MVGQYVASTWLWWQNFQLTCQPLSNLGVKSVTADAKEYQDQPLFAAKGELRMRTIGNQLVAGFSLWEKWHQKTNSDRRKVIFIGEWVNG